MILKNKRVLVTGADGFIGSHLVHALIREGANVIALVYYNSWGTYGWLNDIEPEIRENARIAFGDIRDADLMRSLTREVDVVFHLAALISIPYSYRAADSFVQTNVHGTLNLLNAANDAGVERFVHISTSEVYGTAQYVPIDEGHPINPQSPYAASKASADLLASSFYRSFNLPVTIARPFNTYGPRQSLRALIPTIIVQCLKNRETLELGTLKARRDFTYVNDTVEGIMAVGASDKAVGEVVNIGSGKDVTVKEVATKIMNLMEVSLPFTAGTPERMRPESSEVWRLQSDFSKATRLCGWKPRVPLEHGLTETIEWFRRQLPHLTTPDFYL